MPSLKRPAGRAETAVSMAVLLILAGIATAILARQAAYSPPSRSSPKPAAPAPSAAAEMDPAAYSPQGFAPMSAAETFGPDDLYVKIDGRADLYLTAGFVALHCRRLADGDDAQRWLEAYVYDMGNADNAFTVFSKQKRPGAVELGELAYRTSDGLYFAHGPYYVEFVASAHDDAALRAMQEFREKFSAAVAAGAGPATDDTALFPAQGMRPGSVSRASAEDLGAAGFEGAFLAAYEVDGATVTAFLSRRPNAEAAAEAAAKYAAAFQPYGATVEPATEIPGGSIITILDTTKIVFAVGPFTAGVHEAPNRAAALVVAKRLYDALKEAAP